MLKKKLLISLVVIQGFLIFIGIIAIIFGVFYKMSNVNNSPKMVNESVNLNNLYLIDKNHYQLRFIDEDKVTFQIIDIKSNQVLREIVIEKN